MKKIVITIDGPAGSGKGRISRYIAKKYNFIHIDSGLLYRKTAKLLIENKTNLNKLDQIKQTLIKNNNFSFSCLILLGSFFLADLFKLRCLYFMVFWL